MLIKQIIIIIIGLSCGLLIAGGLYAFIAMVGVLTRLATRTKTAGRVMLYEDMVTLGAGIGNLFFLLPFSIPLGKPLILIYGFFSGIFVGCLAMALAEVINMIPTFARRVRLKKGIIAIVCVIGAAKILGTLFQLVFMGTK